MPLCRNSSGRISFYDFPKAGTVREKEWIVKIRQDSGCNFVVKKHTKIYFMHFTQDDFVSIHPDYLTVRLQLKPNAVPSRNTQVFQQNSLTSQIASSAL